MTKICKSCGWHGEPKPYYKNNLLIEIVLWLVFIPFGIIYSAVTRINTCGGCSAGWLIDTDTPKGKELMEKYNK